MKKLILLCLLSLTVRSQPPTQTVTIINASPTSICRLEAITVEFKYKYTGTFDASISNQFSFYYLAQNLAVYQIRLIKSKDLFHLNKHLVGSDTIYSFSEDISISVPLGNYQVRVSPEAMLTGKNIEIIDCHLTGIEELQANELKPIYYDLQGNIIEPRSNELIIKQVGHKRFKVIIE